MNDPIQDKAPKPPGLLPKNVQSWVIVSIAVLMVAIMWLTGGKKPPTSGKTAPTTVQVPAPVEVNESKIAELQNRIQDLQKQQLAAQNALAQQTRLLGTEQEQAPPQSGPATNGAQSTSPEDAIKAERQKRAYLSLFASNIALSYRKDLPTSPAPGASPTSELVSASVPAGSDPAPVAELLKQLQAPPRQLPADIENGGGTAAPKQISSATPVEKDEKEGKNGNQPPHAPHDSANAASGKTYILFEGTILETILINRLDGHFSGPVECLLASDVYSHDRQRLLIPAGSKILGETKRVDTFGQTRLAVVFHRLIMPDGYSVSLDQFKGLDQIGDTGLRDQVNNHYLRIFGTSLAIGALGAVAEAGTGGTINNSNADLMRQGFAASTAQSAAQILDRFLNILPTVTIREGHRVKVYLSGDLALPDYANHKMPSDL